MVLSDVRRPGLGGLGPLRLLKERAPDVDVVLMTAFDDLATVATSMREGASDFLVKPLDLHELRGVLDRVFADQEARDSQNFRTGPEANVLVDYLNKGIILPGSDGAEHQEP